VSTRAPLAAVCAFVLAAGAGPLPQDSLAADLDRIFDDPALERATVAVRIQSLSDGAVLYARNAGKHVVPGSNMKIVTMAAAAERLGWDYRYRTTLEAAGNVADGTLTGDLVVTGAGDPSIGSQDARSSLIFLGWADALRQAGFRRVHGRLIGDDNAFDDDARGAGWAWDNLTAGYAAPAGALSYNENVTVVRIAPGAIEDGTATVTLTPPGAPFDLTAAVVTGPAGSEPDVVVRRELGSKLLTVAGRVPAGGDPVVRTTSIENPTRYFVGGLAAALAERGIVVTGGAWDIDDIDDPPVAARRTIATRESLPLSSLGGYFMKDSQNFYGEMFLKTLGLEAAGEGTAENGRRAVREVLADWGVPADAIVMYDGSGLSRYDYVTADAIVTLLEHVWNDERLRGPFVAALPVGGRDGTLASRMKAPAMVGRVQAKTGTLNHVRALSGYLTGAPGRTFVFSMIANHFTAPSGDIDAIMERALERVLAHRSAAPASRSAGPSGPAS
jgi:D-alanyl-D-alanine carboxypeptidase/D-alanyl-D-alanine-endopeptidase (penicillin-binding protein 4)